ASRTVRCPPERCARGSYSPTSDWCIAMCEAQEGGALRTLQLQGTAQLREADPHGNGSLAVHQPPHCSARNPEALSKAGWRQGKHLQPGKDRAAQLVLWALDRAPAPRRFWGYRHYLLIPLLFLFLSVSHPAACEGVREICGAGFCCSGA